MVAFRYYLGPWQWVADPQSPHWAPPEGTVGCLDLRSTAHCGTPEVQDGVGFFATTAPLDSSYDLLGTGDLREVTTSGKMRSTFEGLTRYRPSGETLCTLIRDCLMAGADPMGEVRCKPLMPDISGNLDIYLGGHGRIHRETFVWDEHDHTAQVQAVLQDDVTTCHACSSLRTTQKVLGGLLRQYGLPTEHWRTFVPPSLQPHIPGPLPPETVITDNFNRADSTSMGTGIEGWSWTEVVGDAKIASNKYACNTSSRIRAESDLSTADQYVLGTLVPATFQFASLCARYASAADTCYAGSVQAAGAAIHYLLQKIVTGTATTLVDNTNGPGISDNHAKLTVSGSTLNFYMDGVTTLQATVTDTAITGNLRTGAGVTQGGTGSSTADDWEAGDFSVSAPLTAQLVWIVSAVSGVQNVVILKGTQVSAIWVPSGGASLTYTWLFADLHGQSDFVSTASTIGTTRSYSVAGGELGTRRVSSTVSSLASAVGSTITSAILAHVTGVLVPNQLDGRYVRESQRARRVFPL